MSFYNSMFTYLYLPFQLIDLSLVIQHLFEQLSKILKSLFFLYRCSQSLPSICARLQLQSPCQSPFLVLVFCCPLDLEPDPHALLQLCSQGRCGSTGPYSKIMRPIDRYSPRLRHIQGLSRAGMYSCVSDTIRKLYKISFDYF